MAARAIDLNRVVRDDLTDKVKFGQSPKLGKRASHGEAWMKNVLNRGTAMERSRGHSLVDGKRTVWLEFQEK